MATVIVLCALQAAFMVTLLYLDCFYEGGTRGEEGDPTHCQVCGRDDVSVGETGECSSCHCETQHDAEAESQCLNRDGTLGLTEGNCGYCLGCLASETIDAAEWDRAFRHFELMPLACPGCGGAMAADDLACCRACRYIDPEWLSAEGIPTLPTA